MTFRAPGLFTEVDPVNYQSEINTNFGAIDSALKQIQTELLALSSATQSSGASNLSWVDLMLAENGPVGFDSWVPSFDQDTDGVWTVRLLHSTPNGHSSALIDSVLHNTSTVLTLPISTIIPATGDGPFRCVIGLNTAGAPAVEQVCEYSPSPTDDPTLVLYTFNVLRTTDGELIQDVRRETRWHADDGAWAEIRDRPTVLQTTIERVDVSRWPNEDTDGVFLIPFDCEVVGVSAYCSHVPVAGEIVEIVLERYGFTSGLGAADRSEAVHLGSWLWGDDTDSLDARTVVERSALNPPAQLLAGDYVNIKLTQPTNVTTDAPLNPSDSDLISVTAQLRIRPIQHTPRKSNP